MKKLLGCVLVGLLFATGAWAQPQNCTEEVLRTLGQDHDYIIPGYNSGYISWEGPSNNPCPEWSWNGNYTFIPAGDTEWYSASAVVYFENTGTIPLSAGIYLYLEGLNGGPWEELDKAEGTVPVCPDQACSGPVYLDSSQDFEGENGNKRWLVVWWQAQETDPDKQGRLRLVAITFDVKHESSEAIDPR